MILLFLLLRLLLHKFQTEWQEGALKDQVRGEVLHSCCFSVYFASSGDFSQPLHKFIGSLCLDCFFFDVFDAVVSENQRALGRQCT